MRVAATLGDCVCSALTPELAQIFACGIVLHGVDIPSVPPCLSSSLIHREVNCEVLDTEVVNSYFPKWNQVLCFKQ